MMKQLTAIMAAGFLSYCGVALGQHHTARFFTSYGSPRQVEQLDFAPDGNHLALAITGGPLTIVDTSTANVSKEIKFDPFRIGYSQNSQQILAFSDRHTKLVKADTGELVDVIWRLPLGYLGCRLQQQSGKLVIDSLVDGGPAAASGKIHTGDEVTGYAFHGYATSLLGKTVEDANKALNGPAGTNVTLQLVSNQDAKSYEVELRRAPATIQGKNYTFHDFHAGASTPHLHCRRGWLHRLARRQRGRATLGDPAGRVVVRRPIRSFSRWSIICASLPKIEYAEG